MSGKLWRWRERGSGYKLILNQQLKFFVNQKFLSNPQTHHIARAVLIHADSIERVRFRDYPVIVADDDVLRFLGIFLDKLRELFRVLLVERSIDFIKHIEARGIEFLYREYER